ncbi:MAG: helix-turn-helix domain-containing protein [Lachnospiraceae bacterium]|nr:helix-turn-helix domain-containing protein [Lachnospiraceae bacterium]
MDQKVVGSFLKELRKEKGITQEQFAEIMGVSGRTVSRWETGSNMPDLDVLILIADYYEVELREILDGERKSRQIDKEVEETVLSGSGSEKKTTTIKISRLLSCVGVITLLIFDIFFVLYFVNNERTEETALLEKLEYTKNVSDVEILSDIIQQQIALGASVSKNLNNGAYIWDNDGRLVGIYWNDKHLRGNLSLAGLDALKQFTCSHYYNISTEDKNRLTGLDISQNPALTRLICTDNEITSIDLSKAPNLVEVSLQRNSLATLDVSQNPKLVSLSFAENHILTLDTSKNPELRYLYCSENNISVLDISKNPKLETLYCQGNPISTLDISKNSKLETLLCGRSVQITGTNACIIDNNYD